MNNRLEGSLQYMRDHREDFLARLEAFIAIPSISASPEHASEIQRCAGWLAEQLRGMGMHNVAVLPTGGHPLVYGERMDAGAQAPTLLLYGHYDVQPPEPLELWESPPFEPQARGEYLYGRGVADMKAQVMAGLAALEAVLQAGPLPLNIKVMVEGEEEIGSPHLNRFIPSNRDRLACDFVLNLDSAMEGVGLPSIVYGLRGIAGFEVTVTGPSHDLHSGLFGGIVVNPVNELCRLVGEMKDADGRITLPGYYDRVRELSAEERADLARTPFDAEAKRREAGVRRLVGEPGYTPLEQNTIRPTLDVNGFSGGYTGAGTKTIIPASASAKITMRLVPDQDPAEVKEQLERFFTERASPGVSWEIKAFATGYPVVLDRENPAVRTLASALAEEWGVPPVFVRMGASVPVVAMIQQHLGVPTLCCGFGLPGSQVHSPNENQHLPTWYQGISALVRYIYSFAT